MLIYVTLLLPLLAGALLPLFRFKRGGARAVYVEAAVLVTSALVWFLILRDGGERVSLCRLAGNQELVFRLDGMGKVFAGLIAVLWPIASLYAFPYMEHEEQPNTFFCFYTMSYAVSLAVAMAGSLFTLYIFFECLTLVTLPLVVHKQDAKSVRAGRMYLYYSISGAALAFIALICVMHFGTTTDFILGGVLDAEKTAGYETALQWIFLLAFVGFGVKAAIFPLSQWLPMASVAPTPVTALLHAVAVVNTGTFAVLRLTYYSFGTEMLYGSAAHACALLLSCVTILYGSVMAVRERHLKRRLAYSTVSNLSYMLLGAALMTPAGMTGSLSHLVMHGIIKITLFFCAGAFLVQTGAEYVPDVRGYARIMPGTCAAFLVGAAALTGIPPLCGFVSKWNLLTASAGEPLGPVAIGTLIVSAVLTAVYLFSSAMPMYFRPLNADQAALAGQKRDPDWRMLVPFLLLCIMMLGLGLFSGPLTDYLRQVSAGLV